MNIVFTIANLDIKKVIVGCLIISGIYYYFFYNDGSILQANIQQTNNLIAEEETKKTKTQKVMAERASIKQQLIILNDKFKKSSEQLPLDFKQQELIQEVSQLAKDSGSTLVSIRPKEGIMRPLFQEIPVEVELSGTFSNLTIFMYYITTLKRITNVISFDIENAGEKKGGILNYNAIISTYRYIPQKITNGQLNGGNK